MAPGILKHFGFGSQASAQPTIITPPPTTNAVRALPAQWYTSQEMYSLERRAIFSRKWLLTTHKLRFKETGDWLRYEIAGFDILLTKDRTGKINAFHNVCRHRAYPVVEAGEKGSAKILACRYHGWSYGLDGKLAKAPGYSDIDGFDKSKNGLFPIHVHIDHNGFVWLNLDGKETPEVAWDDDFRGVDVQKRFEPYNFDDYEYDHSWSIDASYNWKIAADNYNECYHCKTTHPDIPALADLASYDVKPIMGSIQHDAATTEEQRKAGMIVASTFYFPNASMNVMPQFFFMQRFFPKGPSQTAVCYEVYRNKNASDEAFQLVNQMYKRVMSEDKALCNLAQKNLETGVFINGEMHPKMEKGPLYFQKLVRENVTEFHAREKAARAEIWPARQQLPESAVVSNEDVEFCSGLACGANGQEAQLAW